MRCADFGRRTAVLANWCSVAELMAGECRVRCCTGNRSLGDWELFAGGESGPITDEIWGRTIEPSSEADDKPKKPSKLASPCCSSSKPFCWRPAWSDNDELSHSPTGPSETQEELSSFRSPASELSVRVCCFGTTALFIKAWRVMRGGGGAGEADLLPMACFAFTISATERGRDPGWIFAFSVTCVSY
jgi:hypothetical protein